jgi:hypothetical protein
MRFLRSFFVSFIVFSAVVFAQKYKVIESNSDYIKVEVDFANCYKIKDTTINGLAFSFIKGNGFSLRKAGEPWLPSYFLSVGILQGANPTCQVISTTASNSVVKQLEPYPKEEFEKKDSKEIYFDKTIYNTNALFPQEIVKIEKSYTMRFAKIAPIIITPYQYNPVSRQLVFNSKIVFKINYNSSSAKNITEHVSDKMTEDFINTSVINKTQAVNWISKAKSNTVAAKDDAYWYSASKEYFKIYVKTKDVYRVTYEDIQKAGFAQSQIASKNLELYCNGVKAPIDVVTKTDGVFGPGDYFQFVGFPPTPTDYTTINIYNKENVYWFSYQSETGGSGFTNKDGASNSYNQSYKLSPVTLHFEKDSLYERLGYAPDDHRDFWYWAKVSGRNGIPDLTTGGVFIDPVYPPSAQFGDSAYLTIRINMHGITNDNAVNPNHDAKISLLSYASSSDIKTFLLGEVYWYNQNAYTFEKRFYVSDDSVRLSAYNELRVSVDGMIGGAPDYSDEIRVNWYEIDYWKYNYASTNHYFFKRPKEAVGNTQHIVWEFHKDNVKIYIPSTGEIIRNAPMLNDSYGTFSFVDNNPAGTEYFCISDDYYATPDSIRRDVSSDLRNITNGADVIVITHPKFMAQAQKFAEFRAANFPDTSITNPRIKVVDVFQIYDEFSYGLLNPFALQSFVKYAFTKWSGAAPSYVVLWGDMSYDYRPVLSDSRPNFVPAIPYQSLDQYGQAASDNMIVCVSGDDVVPDLAIGRLSCETLDEANILLNKIMNYPSDYSKYWKQNAILIASGQNEYDNLTRGFNDKTINLESSSTKPNGYRTTKIFKYVGTNPNYVPYAGDAPEIRAAINKGAAMVNFYGHGGGYQWDFMFQNSDILELDNGGRLPVVTSVTCYTAHFDNQDVFGEQFDKIANKGSIGFWGSSGLTYLEAGVYLNERLYDEIFNQRDFIIGKAIMNAKSVTFGGYSDIMTALLVYLGDPTLKIALPEKPDFTVTSADISITPTNPVLGDTVKVKVNIANNGTSFPSKSVTVQLFANGTDTASQIGKVKLENFSLTDSVTFSWIPTVAKTHNLIVKINDDKAVPESDLSDNTASASFVVYNISDPDIVSPINGFSTSANKINFLFSDVGFYASKDVTYSIEIDTIGTFSSLVESANGIVPNDGLLKWTTSALKNGVYFWRTRVFDGITYGKWSPVYSFTITAQPKDGFYAANKGLKLFSSYNMNYSDSLGTLVLNESLLPPKPSQSKFLENWAIDIPINQTALTTITNDGTYIYSANYQYYQSESNIYITGTGYNGTVAGKSYGVVPNFSRTITNTIFYHNGFIYAAVDNNAYALLKINPKTGETTTVNVPDGMICRENGLVSNGTFYLYSDGTYVYDIAMNDSVGNSSSKLRIFDPAKNWTKVGADIKLSGESWDGTFVSFFVDDGYVFTYENYWSGDIKRHKISTGSFEEEWPSFGQYQGFYAWTYDKKNNVVYASQKNDTTTALRIFKFSGEYSAGGGTLSSQEIGPANKWTNLSYDIETTGSMGSYSATIEALNKKTQKWDTVGMNIAKTLSLGFLDGSKYNYLKFDLAIKDSSSAISAPMKFKNLNVSYTPPGDIIMRKSNFTFTPDTLLQGLTTTLNIKAENIGYSDIDSVKLNYYLDSSDSAFYSAYTSVKKDTTSSSLGNTISTTFLLPSHTHKIKIAAQTNEAELFAGNNLVTQTFYVARDSVNPKFSITYDGKEILDGDVISSRPKIIMTLTDSGPLPLDKSYLTVTFDNKLLDTNSTDVKYTINSYPSSRLLVEWSPKLEDGQHTVEILGKDASGNFFDTTSYRKTFLVYNQADIRNIYNFPNPFKNDTYFTFDLYGSKLPDDLYIKIYTVAGRLIRTVKIPISQIQIGFNRIYWDGKDEDRNELANGVYFYKVVYKNNELLKTGIQKLAKVK